MHDTSGSAQVKHREGARQRKRSGVTRTIMVPPRGAASEGTVCHVGRPKPYMDEGGSVIPARAVSNSNGSQLVMSDTRRRARTRGSLARARRGIILAGGEGKRMRHLINSWLGGSQPKQYCAFVGSRSMFQHTIDRARSVVSEEHIVTIIARNHRKFLSESANGDLPGLVIEQPRGAWKRDFSRSG